MRKYVHHSILLCFSLFLAAYFGYFLIYGPRGMAVKRGLETELAEVQKQVALKYRARKVLENRVTLLSGSSIDQDMAVESLRRVLHMTREGEYVVFE